MVRAGNVPTLRLLVAHGARLLDSHLATAVKHADFPMVRYLVEQGMDVNAAVVKEATAYVNAELAAGGRAATVQSDMQIAAFLASQGQRP